jgi:hypothetical protein
MIEVIAGESEEKPERARQDHDGRRRLQQALKKCQGEEPDVRLAHPIRRATILLKQNKSSFKWRHYPPEVILLCVRW